MVRANHTTCLRAKNVEELENALIHAFSEEGDWVLDLCCKGRELSLAAMKTGRWEKDHGDPGSKSIISVLCTFVRFAVAVDDDLYKLEALRTKAAFISSAICGRKPLKRGIISI